MKVPLNGKWLYNAAGTLKSFPSMANIIFIPIAEYLTRNYLKSASLSELAFITEQMEVTSFSSSAKNEVLLRQLKFYRLKV